MKNFRRFTTIIFTPLWKFIFSGPPFIYGWFAFVRDDFLPPNTADKLRLGGGANMIAWFWYVIVGIAIWGLWTAWDATKKIVKLEKELNKDNSGASQVSVVRIEDSTGVNVHNNLLKQNINNPEIADRMVLSVSVLEERSLRLVDLFDPENFCIHDKTFKNCTLYGPAIIYLTPDIAITNCQFDSPVFEYYWELKSSDSEQKLYGVIGIRRCRFENCKFFMIGIAGDVSTYKKLQASFNSNKK